MKQPLRITALDSPGAEATLNRWSDLLIKQVNALEEKVRALEAAVYKLQHP